MIQHALHEEQYLNAHKFYKQIYDSESIKQDDSKWKDVSVYFTYMLYKHIKGMFLGSWESYSFRGLVALW